MQVFFFQTWWNSEFKYFKNFTSSRIHLITQLILSYINIENTTVNLVYFHLLNIYVNFYVPKKCLFPLNLSIVFVQIFDFGFFLEKCILRSSESKNKKEVFTTFFRLALVYLCLSVYRTQKLEKLRKNKFNNNNNNYY